MLMPNALASSDPPPRMPIPVLANDAWAVQLGEAMHHEPVLIVEDERVSRRALAALLTSKGYPTQAVATAEEALQLVSQSGHGRRILLVDLDLPGMNGLELIGHLLKIDPPVGIVMITAARNESVAARLSEYGAAYLRKPLNFDELLGLLAQIDHGGHPATGEVKDA